MPIGKIKIDWKQKRSFETLFPQMFRNYALCFQPQFTVSNVLFFVSNLLCIFTMYVSKLHITAISTFVKFQKKNENFYLLVNMGRCNT